MEKVWKRLIAVSLSLMLMFTMGLNVFAAENVDGTPSDDPAVSLDESDAVATDVEPADEAVVQDEASDEVVAMSTSESGEVLVDNSTTLGDGEYVVNWTGGTSRVKLSCEKVVIQNGEATATFTTTSNSQTHVYTGSVENADEPYPELYDAETDTCAAGVYPIVDKSFTIPVDLNKEMPLSIRTTASMSGTPSIKWTHYSYNLELEEPEWKPSQNQDKSTEIVSALGMLCAASKGTTLTVNPDATITLHATTKPMISQKYTKIAISTDAINNGNVEEMAAATDAMVFVANDAYKNLGQRPYYWSVFEYTFPVDLIGGDLNIWGYNTLIKSTEGESVYEENLSSADWQRKTTWTIVETPELIAQVREACENASSEEAKAAFESVLSNSNYNLSGGAVDVDAIPAQTYSGSALVPDVTVKMGDYTLKKGVDYETSYANNVNAGTAKVTLHGKGSYFGEKTASFTINKADNTLSVSGKSVKIKKKAVKKKAQKLAATKVLTVRNAQGKVTYKGVGVNKKSKKALKINAAGQVTVKKKTKKGTYKMKVTVTAVGDGNYKAASVTRTITVKVK